MTLPELFVAFVQGGFAVYITFWVGYELGELYDEIVAALR